MDAIQQGIEDLLAGRITPAEYIHIVRRDIRETAARGTRTSLISDGPVDWSRYEKTDGPLVGTYLSKGRTMTGKNYDLPEGYTYQLETKQGKGIVSVYYKDTTCIGTRRDVESVGELSEILVHLSGVAASHENRLNKHRAARRALVGGMKDLLGDSATPYRVLD